MKKYILAQSLDIWYVASPSGPIAQIMPLGPKMCPPHKGLYKINFSEYGHVAYQIYRNEACNNMLANSLTLTLTLDPWDGIKRIICFLF